MIAHCSNCKRDFWQYNGTHPAQRFCSVPCKDARRAEKDARRNGSPAPGIPAAVLQLIYSHRRIVHETESVLAWFDCEECERLERLYGESVEWHYQEITAEIVSARVGGATG